MTEYGQSIPNRVVQLTNQLDVTKSMFTHLMAKALVKAGMQFISSWSTFNVLDPANAELGTPGQNEQYRNFFFDFPSTETYIIDSIPYRPCVSFAAHTADNSPTIGNTAMNGWTMQLGRRRADRLLLSDFRTSIYYRSASINYGNYASYNLDNYKIGMTLRGKNGPSDTVIPKWRPFAATATPAPNLTYTRNFASIFVYLGKAGLFCFVGSGLTGPSFCDFLSAGIVFAGGRIPGRARIPAQDVNLNRINPTIELPMLNGVSSPDYWDGGVLRFPLLGIQHDLNKYPEYPTLAYIYNLENVEQPIYSSQAPQTLRSPRIANSAGAYILSRPIIVPQYVMNNGSLFAGPIDTQITGASVRPQWEDVFTAPSFRFGDRTVTTPQEYVDPLTLKRWFLVYAENTNMAYALAYDDRTITNDATLVKNPYGSDVVVDFSVGGLAGPFPAGVVVTKIDSTNLAHWTAVPASNEVQIVETNNNIGADRVLITYNASLDPTDVSYVVEFETRMRATSSNVNVRLFSILKDANGSSYNVQDITATSSIVAPAYNYQLVSVACPVNGLTGLVEFELHRVNYSGVNDANPRMRNFRIKKFRVT